MVYFSLLIYERVIAMNQSIQIKEDYADNLMLTREDMKPYDVDRTFEKVMEKLKQEQKFFQVILINSASKGLA